MQRIDQHKGVLVDGIAVVGIADHQSVDAVELRNQQLEDPHSVHRPQCVPRIGPAEHFSQSMPQGWALL